MSDKNNDLFDDEVEMSLDEEDNDLDFTEADFEDDSEDENLELENDGEPDDDELEMDDMDEFDDTLFEEDLSVFDIDIDEEDLEDDEDESEDNEDEDSDNESEEASDNDSDDGTEDKSEEETDGKSGDSSKSGEKSEDKSEKDDDKKDESASETAVAVASTEEKNEENVDKPKKKKKKALIIVLSILGVLLLTAGFLFGTAPGRKVLYNFVANYLHGNMEYVQGKKDDIGTFVLKVPTPTPIITQGPDGSTPEPTGPVEVVPNNQEDEVYAKNYLLFGIEEINGAANTDSIMLLTINKRDKTLKFTSLLRDTYVDIPGSNPNKINAAYAFGMRTGDTVSEMKYYGGMKLIEVIENTYDLKIEGFACVNFKAFESIIDILGGVDIELGSSEASYLRRTNYISNPAYRTVQTGWNHMNGNQALGYCRVRKVATLGGANNDYGRTVRQRRVIKAVINAYASKDKTELLSILSECLSFVTTNMTAEQITEVFADVIENQIFNFEEARIPFDGMFKDSGKTGIFNGRYNVTYALVIDDYRDQNIEKLHEFLFNDPTAVVNEEDTTDSEEGEAETIGEITDGTENADAVTPVPAP